MINGVFCAREALNGEFIHSLTGNAMFISRLLRKTAHRATCVGVLEAVHKHMII